MARFEIVHFDDDMAGGRCECHPETRFPGGFAVIGPSDHVRRRMFAKHRPSRYGKQRVFFADGLWHGAGGKTYSTWEAAMRSLSAL